MKTSIIYPHALSLTALALTLTASACSIRNNSIVTFYGYPDNTPPSAGIAYNCGRGNTAGGTGTYADPLTFASAEGEYVRCEIIYLPYLEKYLRYEDSCAECTDHDWGIGHIDVWCGSSTVNGGQAQIDCEDALTPDANQAIVRQPRSNLSVNAAALFQNGTCYNASTTYPDNSYWAFCGGESSPGGCSLAGQCSPSSAPSSSSVWPSLAPSSGLPSFNKTSSSSSSALNIGLAVAGSAVALSAVIFCASCYCCCYKTDRDKVGVLKFDPEAMHQARSFTLSEVKAVTNNFERKLGEGSYGPVYYGRLPDGSEVAVKLNHKDSRQGTAEFINEVLLLSRVHHMFLVSLVGYCEAMQEQILIYAYMPNGTLTEHLHGELAELKPLLWGTRLDIALNAAQGLEYLHKFCNPPIIHRDVKPSNILLDRTFQAKVADFGMSKSFPPGSSSNSGFTTEVKGTLGYLDPEYLTGWRLTEKSDIYSFGVVLLELITGRVPTAIVQCTDGTAESFMTWTKTAQKNGNIHSIVDPVLANQFNTEAMWKVAELGWASIEAVGSSRPNMGEIVRRLTEAIHLEISSSVDITTEPSSAWNHPLQSPSDRVQTTTELRTESGRNQSQNAARIEGKGSWTIEVRQ